LITFGRNIQNTRRYDNLVFAVFYIT